MILVTIFVTYFIYFLFDFSAEYLSNPYCFVDFLNQFFFSGADEILAKSEPCVCVQSNRSPVTYVKVYTKLPIVHYVYIQMKGLICVCITPSERPSQVHHVVEHSELKH